MTAATVREAVAHIRLDLDTPQPLTDPCGRTRRAIGLRIDYARRADGVVRTDVTAEFEDSARLVSPFEDHPKWLLDIVDSHRPAFLDSVAVFAPVRTGMGSFPMAVDVPAAEPRECRTCGEPADAAGRIEHRAGTPCTTDYRAI